MLYFFPIACSPLAGMPTGVADNSKEQEESQECESLL